MSAPANAAQLSSRKITLGSSKISTSNTYSVSFIPATATSIKGIIVDFCTAAAGPLIGTACSGANHPVTGIQTSGTVSVTQTSGFGTVSFTAQTPAANSGKTLDMTAAGGTSGIDTVHAVTFSFTATNPSSVATFYARIITYSTTADTNLYDPTTGGSGTNPGSNTIDQGSVALSTANEITVNARVNEILQFCVGTTTVNDDSTTITTNCGAFTGACANTAINLGTLDPSAISVSPVSTTPGLPGSGNACNGAAQVRTNASLGVVVSYFAEQDTSSGQLKVVGAACSAGSLIDQCFNDSSSQAAFTAGTEKFGMTIGGTNCNGTTTPNYGSPCSEGSSSNQLHALAPYIGNSVTAYGTTNGYAWVDTGSATNIASSSGPVDDETLVFRFAATPSVTTPTGNYQVISNYIATATF